MSIEKTKELSSQQALDLARTNGWRIVVPTTHELLIDIDSDADLQRFKQAYDWLERFKLFHPTGYTVEPSKSGNPERQHITVHLTQEVTPIERIALQAILGSDWKREFHSIRRMQHGDTVPTLFYEK